MVKNSQDSTRTGRPDARTGAPGHAMAESDDLMNLGPFIKNYVFNAQPLHNLSLIAKLENNHLKGTGDNNSTVKPRKPVKTHAPEPRNEAQEQKLNTVETDEPVESDVCRPLQNNGVGQSLPYKKRNWDTSGWSPPKFKPKFLTEKQTKIKNWLTANYTYCPRQKNAKVSSRGVLQRAVKEFGPLTQKALGFLMYQAFPGVERMKDMKKGHIFKGIMDKNPSKRSRTRKDRSGSPGSRAQSQDDPASRPLSRNHDPDESFVIEHMEEELDENEAPDDTMHESEAADDHRLTSYELVEVKTEPRDYDDRINGYHHHSVNVSPHGVDLRTKQLKQEPTADYNQMATTQPDTQRYSPDPMRNVSPVSDVPENSTAPLVINYPLLRQSLRGKQFLSGHEVRELSDTTGLAGAYYPVSALTSESARTGLSDNTSTVFSHLAPHHAPQPAAAYFKLPQTLPEAHEQLAYLLRYIQVREEKFADVEKQFANLTGEFQKMAASLREFHVDQVEFFKKVGYTHVSPCDGNNN